MKCPFEVNVLENNFGDIYCATAPSTPFERMVQLHPGDEIYVSRNAYKVKPGFLIPGFPLMCMRLIKRDKWWQFWKPRYKGAIYRMIEW